MAQTLTQEGFDAIKAELENLKTKVRKEVSEKIKEARSFGDLSENAEYDEAKKEQAEVEAHIAELENLIKEAVIVNSEAVDKDVVSVGSKVKIKDLEFDDELEYSIVGSAEANLDEGKLSYESPIGAAINGHRAGDVVTVNTPGGEALKFEILEIL